MHESLPADFRLPVRHPLFPGASTRLPAPDPLWTERAPALLLVIGSDGHIEQASALAESLLSPDAGLVGRPWDEVASSCAMGAVLSGALARCRGGEAAVDCSGPLCVDEEDTRWVDWRVLALDDHQFGPPRVLIWGTDVTRRRQLECELEQIRDRAILGQMVTGVAHELRNPLAAVLGLAELLEARLVSPSEKALVTQLREQAERAQHIVSGTLSLARPETGLPAPCDLNQVVAEAIQFLRYQFEVAGTAVLESLEAGIPPVLGNARELGQVITNLLTNAHQAVTAAGGGEIHVATYRDGSRVCVAVSDDGPGFDPGILPRAFEPFTTTKPTGQGTGLGLFITRGIVDRHRGTIRAVNRPQGGAQVTVELPALAAPEDTVPPPTATPVPHEPEQTAQTCPRRVLVVDDEEPLRLLLQEALSAAGYEVECAGDGEAALDMVRGRAYDIILCDLRMPGMSGEDFYAAIGNIAPQLQGRIVFSTGDTAASRSADFLLGTGLPLLEKPFSIRKMLDVVSAIAET